MGSQNDNILSAPAPARLGVLGAALIALLACLALVHVPAAHAARIHKSLASEILPERAAPFFLAVGQANGDFYTTTNLANGVKGPVYRFQPNGSLDGELTGAPGLVPFAVAVDNSAGGYVYASDTHGTVQQFDAAGVATTVTISEASVPEAGTAQGGGLPPVVNPGSFTPRALAVDATGNVFVVEEGAEAIDEFDAAGEFEAQLVAGDVNYGTRGIAAGGAGDLYLANQSAPEHSQFRTSSSEEGAGLFEIDTATGECVQAGCKPIDPEPVYSVAFDGAAGTLFTTAIVNEEREEGKFTEYEAGTGKLLGATFRLHSPYGIGVNEATGEVIVADRRPEFEGAVRIFGPAVEVPTVTTLAPEDVTDGSAILRGEINAEEGPEATCSFQYADQEAFEAHGFEDAAEAPCEPAGPFTGDEWHGVDAHLEGLRGGTTYHERIVGADENGANPGEDLAFVTNGPALSGVEAVQIEEGAATLTGTIDPRGLAGTYVLQYLTRARLEADGWAGANEVPTGGGQIGLSASGSGDLQAGPSAAGNGILYSGSSAVGSGDLAAGSEEVTSLTTAEGAFEAGQPITGEGIPANTTITAVEPGALVLSAKAKTSGAAVALAAGARVVASLNTEEGPFEAGEPIAGQGIPSGTTIAALGDGALVLSAPAQAAAGRVSLASGSRVVTSLATAEGAFAAGQTLAGPGLPADAKVVAVSSDGTELGLSAPVTETATGAPLTATAPLAVSERIEGLVPGTAYRFRLLATTAGGLTSGQTTGDATAFVTYAPSSATLPDGRRWEQVSPPEKNGGNAEGELNVVHASPNGERITYFSSAGFPVGEGAQQYPSYLSTRAADGSGWSTRGLLPSATWGPRAVVLGFSEDLRESFDFAAQPFEGARLLRRDAAGTVGAIGQIATSPGGSPFAFAGSSENGVALLESEKGGLLPGDREGAQNVYAYSAAAGLVLAGTMNDGSAPAGGAMAGPYDWWNKNNPSEPGGALDLYFTQEERAISADGRTIFFTAAGTGQLYARRNPLAPQSAMAGEACTEAAKACTVRVSAPAAGVADPETPAAFVGASASGRIVYFLDKGRLTEGSTAGPGYDLYRYDLATGALADLTVDHERGGARVEGMLGVSEDGSRAYFVASGVLAAGASLAPFGEANLYALEGTKIAFLARLGKKSEAGELEVRDGLNWIPRSSTTDGRTELTRTSRVSSDGRTLLLRSTGKLTSYANRGQPELYLYRAGKGTTCISCMPTGEAPSGPSGVQEIPQNTFRLRRDFAFTTHNLSADGQRVVFDSADRLLSADKNHVNDVYEWEAPDSSKPDSCTTASSTYQTSSGGCLYLLSSGAAEAEPSYFADADEEGENIFIFTYQRLVAQDKDQLVDVYDARVGGGIPAQEAVPSVPCENEQGCLPQAAGAPPGAAPASPAAAGANVTPAKRCKKGRVRRHGRCVPRRRHKRHRHHHKRHRHHGHRGRQGKGHHRHGHGKGRHRQRRHHPRGARKGGSR